MGNAGLNESQSGIKIARRNINNLRYADDTTLMAETKEELNSLIFFLKSLLMKVKEESGKSLLNTQRSKNKDHGIWPHSVQFSSVAQSCPTLCKPMNCSAPGLPVHHHLPEFTQITARQINGKKWEHGRFYSLGLQSHCGW